MANSWQGEFPWHAHAAEDEMFLVVYGRLRIQLEGGREVQDEMTRLQVDLHARVLETWHTQKEALDPWALERLVPAR